MKNDTTIPLQNPEASAKDVLTEILRDGAREMLGKAVETEVPITLPPMPTSPTPMTTAWSSATAMRPNVNFRLGLAPSR